MPKLIPFADDAASVSIADLTIENGTDRVAVYGSLDLTRDKIGLEHALALKEIVDEAVRRLQAEKDLPNVIAASTAVKKVPNPFA